MTDRPGAPRWRGPSDARPAEPRPAGEASPRFKVSELLGKAREAILVHGGEEYRLRITSNGKLILTK
jgi:hemin uptake protein HemP